MPDKYYEFDDFGCDMDEKPVTPDVIAQMLLAVNQPYMFTYVQETRDTSFINGQVSKCLAVAVNASAEDAIDMIASLVKGCSNTYKIPETEVLGTIAMRILQ